MNVTENYMLQQMQQMASNMNSMPEIAKSTKEKGESFQDMLDQTTAKDSAAQETNKAPEAAEKPEQPVKDTQKPEEAEKAPVQEEKKAAETGKPLETQGDPNAMALLLNLYRPQIVDATEPEAAVSVPVEAVAEDMAPAAPEVEGLTEVLQPEVQTAVETVPQQQVEAPQVQDATQEAVVQDVPQEAEAPVETETVEKAPEEVQAAPEQTEQVRTERNEDLPEVKVETDETEEPKGEAVENGQQVFQDVKAEPVKVGEAYETVDTEKPEMDEKLAATIRQADQNGADRVEIKLNPANLGTVTIEMTRDPNGALQIVLHATNGRAANLLSQHLDGLHAALANYGQGQEVHVEVQRNQESPEQHMFQQADPDGRGQHHQQRQRHQEEQAEGGEDFLQKLRLGLVGLGGL